MKNKFFSSIFLIFIVFSFEEMRIRYERRDPRPEDIRRIDELKSMVDSQEKDIFYLTEQLRELQLVHQQQQQQMQNQINQQNSNQPNNKRNKGKNNTNNNTNNINNNNTTNNNKNRANNIVNQNNSTQQMRNNNQQQQSLNHDNEQQHQHQSPQRMMRPPPLIKTVIYEEENENELYEEQLREERARNFTVELVPESPDYSTKNRSLEEISEALIVQEHEIINQRVIPSPTPDDFKNQEIAVEVISTIEPSNIQVIPMTNGLDLELD